MLTIKDGKKILTTPVSAEDLKDIHIGDVVYLNGDLTTCRDVAHRRLVEEGRPLPVDVKDAAIFHAGPIIRPLEDDKFEMVSVGPTTSMRMEKFEYEFVQKSGVRVIVGKGGMGPNTERGCKEVGAIHCVFLQVRHDKDTFDAASFYKAYKANSFNIPSVAPALPFTNWPALSPAAFKTSA